MAISLVLGVAEADTTLLIRIGLGQDFEKTCIINHQSFVNLVLYQLALCISKFKILTKTDMQDILPDMHKNPIIFLPIKKII